VLPPVQPKPWPRFARGMRASMMVVPPTVRVASAEPAGATPVSWVPWRLVWFSGCVAPGVDLLAVPARSEAGMDVDPGKTPATRAVLAEHRAQHPVAPRGLRATEKEAVGVGVLADADLVGFPKTSGGRGVHVFVPIKPVYGFVEARHAVIALGRELSRRMPDHVTVNWWKEERGTRIFVDFNQMARDRTIASAYSIRPTPKAVVSAPLTWDELSDVVPDDFTISSMPARFADVGDAWRSFYEMESRSLEGALEMYARDERELGTGKYGGAEMPYPPDYPKMPGEPARVQPSRMTNETKEKEGLA